ncbi:hypothetical protein H3C61_02520 [Candidatus Gracilibacteria bacterium]|nr:hypothetical protein [Candidatus Gracilibacteria bacterium]
MKNLYLKALKAYLEMLEIHIDTKTSDLVFHEKTGDFYEKLFEIAHSIGERYVDLDGKLRDDSLDLKKQKSLEILKSLLKDIEDFGENNKLSYGTDDLLGGIADDLEDLIGTAKGFNK